MKLITVKELIELLKKMPQEAIVVGRGYEEGMDSVSCVGIVKAIRDNWDEEENRKEAWYIGDWTKNEDNEDNGEEVVFIG